MTEQITKLQNILRDQELLVQKITDYEKNSERELFVTKIANIIKNMLLVSDNFQNQKDLSESDSLFFLEKFESTTVIVENVVRIVSTIDETDKPSLLALRMVIRGLIDSVRQFQGVHVGDNIEGLEAEIDNLGYTITTLDSTVNTLQDPIVRSIDTITSMNDTIDDLLVKLNTINVLEKSVSDILEKVDAMHNIDAKTIESVHLMGNNVITIEKSVNEMSIAMKHLEALDWKSVESMNVMDTTLVTLRESITKLDAIDATTLDSMKNMVSTIDAMKISLEKLDKIDLSTIDALVLLEKTNADLKYSIDFLKQIANKNKDDLAQLLIKISGYDDAIKRLVDKDAVIESSVSSSLDLIHVIEQSLLILSKDQKNIIQTTDILRDDIKRLDQSDIDISKHLEQTNSTMSSLGKNMYVVGESIKSLREQDSKNEEHVLLLERTVMDLNSLVQKLDVSDKKNITTIGTLNTIIDVSNQKIQKLEIIIDKLEQHSTKVLVVSIEKIEKINKMLLSDVEHLNVCLRDYEARPDKTKKRYK